MDAQSAQLTADTKAMVEKCRSIFDWDAPDVDEALSDRLILRARGRALDGVVNPPQLRETKSDFDRACLPRKSGKRCAQGVFGFNGHRWIPAAPSS
jgi:hypothetical protein